MKHIKTITIFSLLALLPGCFTISVNFSGAKVPPDAKTFSVQMFTNNAGFIQPGLALELTEALRDKIESQTSLKLVSTNGDLIFEGEIYKDDISSKSLTADEVAAQNRYTVGVKVKHTNVFDEKSEFEKNFEQFEEFPGGGSVTGARSEYTDDIVKNLVDDIFKEAFVNW